MARPGAWRRAAAVPPPWPSGSWRVAACSPQLVQHVYASMRRCVDQMQGLAACSLGGHQSGRPLSATASGLAGSAGAHHKGGSRG